MANETNQEAPQSNGKATGGLEPTTGMLLAGAIASPGQHPHFIRGLALHFAETAIFLVAVIGAIALGLGITAYFGEHHYVLAYLVAYAGFRFSDLIVREDAEDRPPHEELSRRIVVQLPLLVVFAAAPFERTYVYGGAATAWSSALGLLVELLGMWLALLHGGPDTRASGAGDARLLSLSASPDLCGHVPGDVRMDAHLWRAGDRDLDLNHRSDPGAASAEVRRSGAGCAIWGRVRGVQTRDGRVDPDENFESEKGYLVSSAVARVELAASVRAEILATADADKLRAASRAFANRLVLL